MLVLQDQYRLLGENVAKIRTDLMKEQLTTFRTQLEDFARKHKVPFSLQSLWRKFGYYYFYNWNQFALTVNLDAQNDIRKNPAFRSQFHDMCSKVGVDPLASNKGFWAELLGIGDFYYELGWYHLLSLFAYFHDWLLLQLLLNSSDTILQAPLKLQTQYAIFYGIFEFICINVVISLWFLFGNICTLHKCSKIELLGQTGVQIVDICLATRPHNGGLINLQELCNLLRQRRKSDREAVSEDDCLRAISKLKVIQFSFSLHYSYEFLIET